MGLPRPTENAVLAACLAWLHARGVFAWRSGNHPVYDPRKCLWRKHRGVRGLSDITGILKPTTREAGGLYLAVECKRPGGEVDPEQRWFLDEISLRGGVAVVAHSAEDLNRLEEWL